MNGPRFNEFILSPKVRVIDENGENLGVMLTAHKRGVCVVAVYTREIAETKATQAIDMAAREGYPLMFTTEPEE